MIGKALVFVGFVLVIGFLVRVALHFHVSPWKEMYTYLELIGAAGTVAFMVLMWLTASERRPFTHVPHEARWSNRVIIDSVG
jgi:hypothetical protein